MRHLKTFENFGKDLKSSFLPPFLKDIIEKIGDWSLVPKVLTALKNTPTNLSEAFDYLSNLFNVSANKEEFLSLCRKEGLVNESWKNTLIQIVSIIAIFLAYVFLGSGVANLYEDDCEKFLINQGYTEIDIRGWEPVAERDEDITAIEFDATKDGKKVNGVVIVGGSVLLDEVNFQVKIKQQVFESVGVLKSPLRTNQ